MNDSISSLRTWLGSGSINIFGLPFSGKDTQGSLLADLFNAPMISSGQILREQKDNQQLQEILATGALVPTELFEEIVIHNLSNSRYEGRPLILSSVGRWFGEEQSVMRATTAANHPIRAVIVLDMPDETVWQRFEASQKLHDRGARADDSRDVLQNRIDEFRQKTMPVIDVYRDNDLLITIDGTASREEVTASILKKLQEKATRDRSQ